MQRHPLSRYDRTYRITIPTVIGREQPEAPTFMVYTIGSGTSLEDTINPMRHMPNDELRVSHPLAPSDCDPFCDVCLQIVLSALQRLQDTARRDDAATLGELRIRESSINVLVLALADRGADERAADAHEEGNDRRGRRGYMCERGGCLCELAAHDRPGNRNEGNPGAPPPGYGQVD